MQMIRQKTIIKEFNRLEKVEKDHYWRWQLLGCFIKEDLKKLESLKIKMKLVDRSNKKIINNIFGKRLCE